LAYLEKQLKQNNEEMVMYKKELDSLQAKIERGEKLVSSLVDEKERWETTLVTLGIDLVNLTGDCILSAAYMSY